MSYLHPLRCNARLCVSRALGCLCLLALAVVSHGGAVQAEGSVPKPCPGKNLLAELKTTDVAAYSRIVAEAEGVPNSEALLWRISKPGLGDSYLFGTAHLPDPRLHRFTPRMTEAVRGASVLALELENSSSSGMMSELMGFGNLLVFTDGQNLGKLLSGDDLARVEDVLKLMGIPPDMARLFKPWVISLFLAVSPCQAQALARGRPSVDEALGRLARNAGVRVIGLETTKEQISAMANLSLESQVASLKVSIRLYDRVDDMTETLVQLYLSRRVPAIWPLSIELADDKAEALEAVADMRANLITRRNLRMRDRSLPLLAEGGAFVAVGALHLPGDDGLVALYRQAGYEVEAAE